MEGRFGAEDGATETQAGTPAAGISRTITTSPGSQNAPEPSETATAALGPTTPPNAMPDADAGPMALREAAARGDPLAQFEIASRYMEGRTVGQNMPKAVEWYSVAAAQGFAPAQYRLGSMYEKGLGIPKDLQSARSWYTRAADKGNAKAIHNLAVLHAEGGLGERNFDRAAQWFKQSANYGVTDSQYNLGILYAQGLGVERDLMESYKWFALAAKAGDGDAGRKRDAVAADLTQQQKSDALVAVSDWQPLPIDATTNTVPEIPAAWQSKPKSPPLVISQTDMIGKAQALLRERGYDPGPADGKLGPQTQNAIRDFQKSAGLPVTGEVDISLIKALSGESI